ncbi:MAG: leucyl/phenylalanyl-tRNA--protein transferase [Betaproteobacteria bacterium]|jgi:leucyl/phenylalanyl-tRNA--protein transferase|nr:leucyl/phenylalanyl-tRNA--protein transferase [Betaproteobacteria bacterium]
MSVQKNHIPWIDESDPLPPALSACMDEASGMKGLVAAGGGLSVQRLLEAYSQGMFPWYSEGQPILWWSPSPRMVLEVENFKLHRSLRKTLQKFVQMPFSSVTFDTAFDRVIEHCSAFKRQGQNGTWILQDMVGAYQALHRAGFAHSVETWIDGELVGGLYCVSIGKAIFGESMFALQTDASKIALSALVAFAKQNEIRWIDCQQNTRHLASLGAHEIAQADFLHAVNKAVTQTAPTWEFLPLYWKNLFSTP